MFWEHPPLLGLQRGRPAPKCQGVLERARVVPHCIIAHAFLLLMASAGECIGIGPAELRHVALPKVQAGGRARASATSGERPSSRCPGAMNRRCPGHGAVRVLINHHAQP